MNNSSRYYYQQPEINPHVEIEMQRLETAISKLESNVSNQKTPFKDNGYKIKYQKELNQGQLEAATTIEGKTLVIAGAGSGKTRTLTYRTSYLLENNIGAEKILILTFTKKAANEIKARVNKLLDGDVAKDITSGTFHSFCYMLLSRYSNLLGVNPKFTILDQGDSRDLIDMLKRQTGVKKKEDIPFPKKSVIGDIISAARNRLVPIERILRDEYPDIECYATEILELYKLYQGHKRANSMYDYDDLIDEINDHLDTNDRFKEVVQNRYQYIMVDEYQDTNIPQKKLD